AVIEVALTVDRDARSAVVDFTGTSPQQPGNFTSMLDLCRRLVGDLATLGVLAPHDDDLDTLARRLHAVVDGLSVQALAGHLSSAEMVAQFDAYLVDLTGREPHA
ncbi:TetR family transcriptional regulator C-terminal domain-containing protein, partial [Streptomyces sp. NPDC001999]